jgi:hypothetical protein
LTSANPTHGASDSITSARWRSLCERFRDIKRDAFRHDLAETWRELAAANPDTPGLLEDWERLENQLFELDRLELMPTTRNWDHDLGLYGEADNDDLDDEVSDYVCPRGRCDRRQSASSGLAARCELYACPMKLEPARPQA